MAYKTKEKNAEYMRNWRLKNNEEYKTYQKSWREKNKEKIKEQNKQRYIKNPETYWAYKIKHKYKLSVDQFYKILKQQNNKCAICKTTIPGHYNKWRVDHDHDTGEIRGLLCHHCNTLLGIAKDNIQTLTEAIQYLTKYYGNKC